MRTLIAVISYGGDAANGAHDAIRETWGKDIPAAGADLRFFIGRRRDDFIPKSDEIPVERMVWKCQHNPSAAIEGCCEDYMQFEMREILRWSVAQGYDFTFLPSTDTFIIPRKLMATGFEKYDYSGRFVPRAGTPFGAKTEDIVYGHHLYQWADAGEGWFLSVKAAEMMLRDKPDHWTDDIHCGQVLGPMIAAGTITAYELPNFHHQISWHYREINDNKAYTHKGGPDTGWMKMMYDKYGRG